MAVVRDDTGRAVPIPRRVRRVVSLVPSLTETVAATDAGLLVGATDWCSHPADLQVVRIRGTKNPDVPRIVELEPDLVLANEEENRPADLDALRDAGVPVWVTYVRTLDQAIVSLRRLVPLLTGDDRPPRWLAEVEDAWSRVAPVRPRLRAIVPIWRRPWMVAGGDTFTGDVLRRLGIDNIFAGHPDRYPKIPLPDLLHTSPDLVVLPDEPYAFSETDGPECFEGIRCAPVSGRLLTWYGPSLAQAAAELPRALSLGDSPQGIARSRPTG
jgi:ABC-type Fe3+-hydroxamate transport system substrate-binding protein